MLFKSLKSIKTSVELVEKYAKAKAFDELVTEITSLQKASFEAYTLAFELYDSYREIKEKYQQTKDWENKVEPNYMLAELAPGVFVYAFKPKEESSNPLHYLCANCFKDKRESILQCAGRELPGTRYHCPKCKADIVDHANKEPFTVSVAGPYTSDSMFKGY
ncbi:hypothetical protein DO021_21545 [Desulfobacter hydrogenophilus]|uniref:Uncharacterized protein n=1 Tax=Desulfobacter hydrogenophilus TaxID=2291 RepID=A0A328F9A0_9BACT|nr:hypothetical protein [Desulfobacter hydrogenophilus]NDY74458.1 hypothetical protein [Desulfobacter hydrogenophilus]QBH14296.1 hypothetical protein EYB58_16060 [Desulfobacter hydrogenophilus]RAL99981.1 hypothetical protein DO021_21545 [Desulfobacter hydrogenophilus]